MFLNEIPNINFAKNSKNIKSLLDIFKEENQFFKTVNFSNEEIYLLFLKSSLVHSNKIEGIDYDFYDITKNDIETFLNEINVENKKIIIIHSKNVIEKEHIFKLKDIQKKKNLRVMLSSYRILNSDENIQGNLSLTEEKSLRTFIESMLSELDKKKITRIISNQAFNEFEANKEGKINLLNSYQLIFNDIESAFLDGINIHKSQLNNNSNIKLNFIDNEEDIVEFNKENNNTSMVEDLVDDDKKDIKKILITTGSIIGVSLILFYITGVFNFN